MQNCGELFLSKLGGKVELDVLEVLLRHGEHIAGISEEDVAAFLVLGHILIFALLEVFEFSSIVTLYPASLIEVDWLPTALGIILVFQAILDDFKLQLAHRTNNLATIELIDEQLGHTLVHQLVDTLLQLLRLHGVVVLDILEQLGRERRQSAEVKLFALRQRVANLEDAIIGQTYNIAWPSLIDGRFALSHKLCGTGETQRLALANMQVGLIALELTAAHLAEGDTRTMVGVDIGCNLEDKTCKLRLIGLNIALLSLSGFGTGGYLHEAVQQLLYTEVVQG